MGRHVRSLASESILVLASTEGFFEGARRWRAVGLLRPVRRRRRADAAGAHARGTSMRLPNTGWAKPGFDLYVQYLDAKLALFTRLAAEMGKPFIAEEFGLTMHQFDEEQRKVVFATVLRALAASKRAGGAFKAALFWNAAHPGINSNNTDVWSGQDTAYEILITPPTGATAGLDGSDPRPAPPQPPPPPPAAPRKEAAAGGAAAARRAPTKPAVKPGAKPGCAASSATERDTQRDECAHRFYDNGWTWELPGGSLDVSEWRRRVAGVQLMDLVAEAAGLIS
ncbi:MAG: hypothetical protein J3K34DRAFT_461448 [Monoraphidium minutum]|nr:MAG: hypothetical protein J3K34DRAFT_461448 [Monoraphidium minutum]